MTAVWEAVTLFWGWREIPLLSQPIITALNISRENNVKFRLKEQSIQEAEKIALKETWLTYENNYSWTDKQQNPDAERNTSDSNWLLPSENRTRRKHYSTHSAPLFSAPFASVHKKTRFSSYQIPACLTKHFFQKEKKGSPCKDVFLSSVHTVPVFACSFNSPLKDVHVIHRRRHFTTMFYFRTLFLLLLLHVSTRFQLDLMETAISVTCVCLCYSLAWLCDSVSDHCIRFSGNLQDSRTLHGHELMKNMSDKIHGYQSSWWKW